MEITEYLTQKYIKCGLLTPDGKKTLGPEDFDPYIYPSEGYIPKCSRCVDDLDRLKIHTTHHPEKKFKRNCTRHCLWYDYFTARMDIYLVNHGLERLHIH